MKYQEVQNVTTISKKCVQLLNGQNSTMKEDIKILDKPKILNAARANILAQIAAIVLLLTRGLSFVVRVTKLFRKLHKTNDPNLKEKLKPPSIPRSIQNLIQLE